jgi:hypothetical protein
MPRWSKGTLDHDGDGKMGGSNPKEPTMTKQRDAAEQQAYEAGRHARSVSIARDQDPHGHQSKLQPHWQAGWDAEDELRTAAPVVTKAKKKK